MMMRRMPTSPSLKQPLVQRVVAGLGSFASCEGGGDSPARTGVRSPPSRVPTTTKDAAARRFTHTAALPPRRPPEGSAQALLHDRSFASESVFFQAPSASPSASLSASPSASPSASSSSGSAAPVSPAFAAAVSAASPSSSASSLSVAYAAQVADRRRSVRRLGASVLADVLLALAALAHEWRSQAYSLSHSLIDVAVLHLCRACAVAFSLLHLLWRSSAAPAAPASRAPAAALPVSPFSRFFGAPGSARGESRDEEKQEIQVLADAAADWTEPHEGVSAGSDTHDDDSERTAPRGPLDVATSDSESAVKAEETEARTRRGEAVRGLQEAERETRALAETGRRRIDDASRVLFLCFLGAVLKAINLRLEDALQALAAVAPSGAWLHADGTFLQSVADGDLRQQAEFAFRLLLLLLPFIEVVWSLVAPFCEGYFLWRVRRSLTEERALLHRRLLHVLAEKKEAARKRTPRGASGSAAEDADAHHLEKSDGDQDEEDDDLGTVEFLKLLRPYFWPSGALCRAPGAPRSFGDSPLVLRLLAVSTFLCIALSKLMMLLSPLCLGAAAAAAAEAARLASEEKREAAAAEGRRGAQYVLAFAATALGAKLLKEAQALAYLKVQQAAYVETSERTLRHLLSLPLEWHVKKQTGHVIRATDRGTEACSSLMTYLFLYLVPAVFECIAVCLVFIFHMRHRVLASLLFLSLSIYTSLTLRVTFWRRKWREAQNQRDSRYHQLAIEALTNFETVKMFSAEDFEVKRYVGAVHEYQELGTKIQASLSFLHAAQQIIVYATLVGGLTFTVQAIAQGAMGVGEFVTVQMYLLNVFAPLNFLGTVYNVIVRSVAEAQNLSHLLATKPGILDAPDAVSLVDLLSRPAAAPLPPLLATYLSSSSSSVTPAPPTAPLGSASATPRTRGSSGLAAASRPSRLAGADCGVLPAETQGEGDAERRRRERDGRLGDDETCCCLQAPIRPLVACDLGNTPPALPYAPSIEFQNVYFSYGGPGRLRRSIRGVNLKVPPCTTCALVGVSGSGKSTLTKLLMRLLEPDSGRVLINGVDISRVTQESLRACIGMVPQDPVMFNATIYENIAYAKPNATFEEVETAAEASQLLPLVMAMKDTWNTRVGERGLRMSGGERQRIAIARCFLRNPPIVLLDEATSSLDSVTEAAIQQGLLRLNSNRTVLMVAHRLSTILHAHQICVMRGGEIVERGTHAELLAKQGLYAELWTAQARREGKDKEDGTEAGI